MTLCVVPEKKLNQKLGLIIWHLVTLLVGVIKYSDTSEPFFAIFTSASPLTFALRQCLVTSAIHFRYIQDVKFIWSHWCSILIGLWPLPWHECANFCCDHDNWRKIAWIAPKFTCRLSFTQGSDKFENQFGRTSTFKMAADLKKMACAIFVKIP